VPSGKRKVLYFGTDIPSVLVSGPPLPKAESLSGNIARLKTLPLDGIGVQLLDWRFNWPQAVVGHNLFSTTRYDYNRLKPAIAGLKELKKAPNLTDNFLLIASGYWFENGPSNPLDLFDDKRWRIINDNLRDYARVAKEAGTIKGFILDIEPYTGPPKSAGRDPEWGFNLFSSNHNIKFINNLGNRPDRMAAYRGQANKRGKQFWEAIERSLPGAVLFLYFGNWWADQKHDADRADLFPPFLDGVMEQMEAMRSKGYIVDGYEPAYTFRAEAEYKEAREKIRTYLRGYSAVPKLYDKYVRVGFAKWLDAENKWDAAETGKGNYFAPSDWEKSLRYALKYSDEYVWLWAGGKARVFPMSGGRDANVPPAYLNATRRARP